MRTGDPDGDVPIDMSERQFTLAETAFLARVPEKSIRNWMARDLVNIGRKNRITGRWAFSILDALRLAVMFDLTVRPGMDFGPARAGAVADQVVRIARTSTSAAVASDGIRPNVNVVIAWTEAGEMLATTADIKEPGSYYPPARADDDGYHPLRRSILTIPVTALATDTMLRTEQLARFNRKAEAPEHV